MKKTLSMLISFILLSTNIVFAADNHSIADKMNSIWLSPIKDAVALDNIKKVNQEKTNEDIALYLLAPGYAREKIGFSADDEIMKQQVIDKYSIKQNEILKVYDMKTNLYARDYADNNALRYLISADFYWFSFL